MVSESPFYHLTDRARAMEGDRRGWCEITLFDETIGSAVVVGNRFERFFAVPGD